jgi:hypothetical protein
MFIETSVGTIYIPLAVEAAGGAAIEAYVQEQVAKLSQEKE